MNVDERARRGVALPLKIAAYKTIEEPSVPTILVLLGVFAALWALYFTIAEAPVAIKHDMAEAYAWGREFQLGYNQHPPFWAWVCGLWFSLFPRAQWAFALLSSVNAGIGLWGAWALIGDFAQGPKRVAAWALLLLTPLYTFYAYKYDANTIFLSIWPWTLHCFMRSLHRRRVGDAVAFGACLGLAMLSKYYALILVATCLLAALQHPSRWRYFASASPYVSGVVAAVICAPHIGWLLTHRAPPLRYLTSISGWDWNYVAFQATRTLLGALGISLGVILVVGFTAWTSRRHGIAAFGRDARGSTVRVLATLTLAPLALTVASALALRTTSTVEMTVGTFPLLPLLVIEAAGVRDLDLLCRISVRLAGAVTLGALALSPAVALARAYMSSNAMNATPFQEVAVAATRLWHDRTSLPLAYVAGSDWYENATAFYSPDRPHVFVHFDYSRNLWVSPEALAKQGLLSVCLSGDTACLAATARFATPRAARAELSLAHAFWGHVAKPVRFVVTVIPPRDR
jgi:4-amino-4-deoxy-L-arabinose transferase-like glycosyltransferase